MPAVTMPDGSVVDLPDNPSPELKKAVQAKIELQELTKQREGLVTAAEAARQAKKPGKYLFAAISPELEAIDKQIAVRKDAIAKAKADSGGFLDKAKYYAEQGGSAVARGLLSLPASIASAGIALDPGRHSQDPTQPMEDLATVGRQPQTTGERYAASGIEGLVSGLTSPGGGISPIRAGVTGLASGLGAEAGGQLLPGTPLGRVLGGLLGGGVTSLATAAKTTRKDLAREATRGVTEQELLAARKTMQELLPTSGGVGLNTAQALGRSSAIDSMVDRLANSRRGVLTQAQLDAQPAAVERAVDLELSTSPGAVRSPQQLANNAQEAADSAVRAAIGKASQAWQKAAPQGSSVPPAAIQALDKKLANLAEQYPNTSGADLIQEARAALLNPKKAAGTAASKILGPDGRPLVEAAPDTRYLTDAMQLRSALEDSLSTFGSRKLNTPGLDATNLRRAQEVREAFKAVLEQHAPKLSQANAAYSQVMSDVVAPMKQSVVGRVAGRTGFNAEQEAVTSRVFGVLDRGTDPRATTSEILTLEKSLRGQPNGPETFQDVFKTWASGKLSKALEASPSNRTPDSLPAAMTKAFGDPGKSTHATKGFDDTLVAVARAKGLPDAALLNGWKQVRNFAAAAANRPAAVGDATRELERVAAGAGQEVLRGNTSSIAFGVRNWLRDLRAGDAYSFMDKLLTTPEGVDTLIKLGKQPVMSNAAVNTLATFAATAATANNPPQQPAGQQ